MTPYPMLFQPVLKPKVWGGRTLERLRKALPPGVAVGESWELADLPPEIEGGRSRIANGELVGATLHDAIGADAGMIMGAAADRLVPPHRGFPLLVKYLDARQNLSVQVHPSPQYAADHPEAHLKSEAWFIVEADPSAVIYKGVKPGVTRETFARHIHTGEVVGDLITIPAKPGDCHYLPSGTCHALGAGILVAEVQTPSDTTFRVYDWGRSRATDGAGGAGRELHIEQALACIDFSAGQSPAGRSSTRLPRPNVWRGVTTTAMAATEYFEIERVDAVAGASFPIVTQELPQVWMMIAGAGRIEGDFGQPIGLMPGATVLIPAAANDWQAGFSADSWLLLVLLPSPLRNMLA
jgi:mannose-6-phosphate isomerase